ncbi:MAG TPA: metallophosphoesterase [Myxococcota bacterium]|nr:metallophosphoesterase [Myxococcota bacterium]
MKILHLTDTHLGNHLRVKGAPEGWTRGLDHEAALARALEPAMREEVDLVIHTGDVFNRSRPDPDAMRGAARLLSRAAKRVPIALIAGNHDRGGIVKSLPFRAPNLWVCDRPQRLEIAGVALALVPYQRRAERWKRASRIACGKGVDLLVTHQAFEGAIVPGLVFRDEPDTIRERHLPGGVRHILCGHIHPRQVTPVGEALVVQPGATERTLFSEANEPKGTVIWDLGRDITFRFVDHATRPMHVLHHRHELRELEPGTLVRLRGGATEEEVLEAGAWLVESSQHPHLAREPAAQLPLFTRRSRAAGGGLRSWPGRGP